MYCMMVPIQDFASKPDRKNPTLENKTDNYQYQVQKK